MREKKLAKPKIQYRCTECDRIEPKWLGMCPGCGQWNTLEEETAIRHKSGAVSQTARAAGQPVPANSIPDQGPAKVTIGLSELDRVLGGGLVPGSVVLLGGEPGIGKSTLLMQVCAALATSQRPALYVTGEESQQQIRTRALRLGVDLAGLHILAGTDCAAAASALESKDWGLAVIDSVQTMRCPDVPSAPGSVSQVRESASRLSEIAKSRQTPLWLIGHVTKEGTLAGPRTLEHMVDTVLYFESDPSRSLRIVRAHKNRHGPVSEVGVFEMTAQGLRQVDNPSAAFLADRPEGTAGSVVLAMLRGSRPLLVEVQALVSPTVSAQPRRTAWGCDPNRAALLAAVLERRAGAQLAGCDLFLNVAGGLSLDEPASDLAICLAILSSLNNRPVPARLVVFGEVGLAGEVRAVNQAQNRVNEAVRLGFDRLVLPQGDKTSVEDAQGAELMGIASVEKLDELALGSR